MRSAISPPLPGLQVNPLQALVTFVAHDIQLIDVPAPLWRIVERMVPTIGNIFGFKPAYPEYKTLSLAEAAARDEVVLAGQEGVAGEAAAAA